MADWVTKCVASVLTYFLTYFLTYLLFNGWQEPVHNIGSILDQGTSVIIVKSIKRKLSSYLVECL
jgi:hypothetical protein